MTHDRPQAGPALPPGSRRRAGRGSKRRQEGPRGRCLAGQLRSRGQGSPAVLVDFCQWCGPCRMIGPVLEEMAATTPTSFVKLNVDGRRPQQFAVANILTILAFEAGEVKHRRGCDAQGQTGGRARRLPGLTDSAEAVEPLRSGTPTRRRRVRAGRRRGPADGAVLERPKGGSSDDRLLDIPFSLDAEVLKQELRVRPGTGDDGVHVAVRRPSRSVVRRRSTGRPSRRRRTTVLLQGAAQVHEPGAAQEPDNVERVFAHVATCGLR